MKPSPLIPLPFDGRWRDAKARREATRYLEEKAGRATGVEPVPPPVVVGGCTGQPLLYQRGRLKCCIKRAENDGKVVWRKMRMPRGGMRPTDAERAMVPWCGSIENWELETDYQLLTCDGCPLGSAQLYWPKQDPGTNDVTA